MTSRFQRSASAQDMFSRRVKDQEKRLTPKYTCVGSRVLVHARVATGDKSSIGFPCFYCHIPALAPSAELTSLLALPLTALCDRVERHDVEAKRPLFPSPLTTVCQSGAALSSGFFTPCARSLIKKSFAFSSSTARSWFARI